MRYYKKVLGALAAIALAATLASPAHAGAINPDGTWVGFCFNDLGPATSGCQNLGSQTSGNDFTFTLSGPAILQITDAFNQGDMFEAFDFGVSLFTTSAVPNTGADTGVSDPFAAYADARLSHGSILLGAGQHQISVFNVQGCCNGGGAYLRIAAVPEPGTLALIAASLIGAAVTRRRKQR